MSRKDIALKYIEQSREQVEPRIKGGIESFRKGDVKITVEGATDFTVESEKPAFTAIKDMFHKEWHSEVTAKATDGTATARVFYGDYDVTVYADGKKYLKTIKVSRDSKNEFKF